MKNIEEIVNNAEHWIKSIKITEELVALRELGLLLCNNIHEKRSLLTIKKSEKINDILTSPVNLMNFNREEILNFTKKISISDTEYWNIKKEEKKIWTQFLGGIALSYAREGDLSVVAAIIKASAHLNLKGEWISDATNFLLEQQQPDGYFGLFARELAISHEEQKLNILLPLTVEILWALAELTHQNNEQISFNKLSVS
ncbi:hypothetical protein [Bacillus cereus]|uniref:hypothetical protein n=1 Tax=Bacillus cereus TaxID=1396 RepID=UPI00192D6142|nr:hypothetical protein [Bacillus cereus]MDA2330937.1 hypothetical protein [Bacillus cereus]MDA2336764.1 hypothetical protein [Bacillus cereus]